MSNPDKIQEYIISRVGSKALINSEDEIRSRVDFLKSYMYATPTKGLVLGISGGLDSTLAGRLCQMAVEELRAESGTYFKFIAMRLPYGVQQDEDDAQRALDFIKPDEVVTFNIKAGVDAMNETFEIISGSGFSDFNKGNLKARMRMIAQYSIAGEQNLLVVGTDQAVEYTMGFYTKYGDGASDIIPLSGLTKDQEKEMARVLGAPEDLVEKTPTADLLDTKPGQSDETELGVSYKHLNEYLRGWAVPKDAANRIAEQFDKTEHKRYMPVAPTDDWWK